EWSGHRLRSPPALPPTRAGALACPPRPTRRTWQDRPRRPPSRRRVRGRTRNCRKRTRSAPSPRSAPTDPRTHEHPCSRPQQDDLASIQRLPPGMLAENERSAQPRCGQSSGRAAEPLSGTFVLHRDANGARPREAHPSHPRIRAIRQQQDLLRIPALSHRLTPAEPRQLTRFHAKAQERTGSEVKGPPLYPEHAQHSRSGARQGKLAQIPGQGSHEPADQGKTRHHDIDREDRPEVHDPPDRHPGRIQPHRVDAVDAALQVEHAPVGADLHHDPPNSEVTVSRRRFTPAGVARSTETIPTAKTPAASLKSRRNASTVAATANASPIRLIATARPVAPALAAADSSDAPPFSPGPAAPAAEPPPPTAAAAGIGAAPTPAATRAALAIRGTI